MTELEMIRHTVATLAYRAAKTMRGAPAEFARFKAGPTTKTPLEIVAHMGDLFDWALTMVQGKVSWHDSTPVDWDKETSRFFAALRRFDDALASSQKSGNDLSRMFQGPIADALTHTGQLAMLRRLGGCPMKGENYWRAEIVIGRVGSDQMPANPKYEFD